MTQDGKLELLQTLTGEENRDVLLAYLKLARGVVLRKLYPFGDGTENIPSCYHTTQVEIAAYMLNKRGAEGETSRTENGVTCVYEDGDIPPTLLRRITPMAGVLS